MREFGRNPGLLFAGLLLMGVVLGSTAMAASRLQNPGGANATNGKPLKLTVTVRVHNYTRVSRGTLAKAQKEVTRIFQNVGLTLQWLECPLFSQDLDRFPDCEHPLGPTGLDLSIVGHGGTVPVTQTTLGFTMSKEGQHVSAVDILYDHVKEQAEAMRQPLPQVLGHAIAHEIGHVLLGPSGHSSTGIMRAQWTAEDLRRAARGQLLFTPEQAERIRAEVLDLTRLQVLTRQLTKPVPNE